TAREWAVYNFSSGCEVADMLVQRLDFGPSVREALGFTFERWNGNGYPAHARGEAIPLAMRVVHLSPDMEAIGRLFSPDQALDAALVLGFTEDAITTLRRAALVHDFGITAVPNSIWDKPGSLTRAEFDRVELHPMLTEQMLRRSPALDVLNAVASAHHEKCDGSGYHKRVQADADDLGACVLAATEIYAGLTTERADRLPFSAG